MEAVFNALADQHDFVREYLDACSKYRTQMEVSNDTPEIKRLYEALDMVEKESGQPLGSGDSAGMEKF